MIAAFVLNSLLVAIAVLIHFEVLNALSSLTPKMLIRHRIRVLIGVFGALVAHVIEIWVFAIGLLFYGELHWIWYAHR